MCIRDRNSIAYTNTDPVALAKALTKVAKDVPAFQFRAGLVEGRVISIAEIQQLSLIHIFSCPCLMTAITTRSRSRS